MSKSYLEILINAREIKFRDFDLTNEQTLEKGQI
jgi:hypothetical protein